LEASTQASEILPQSVLQSALAPPVPIAESTVDLVVCRHAASVQRGATNAVIGTLERAAGSLRLLFPDVENVSCRSLPLEPGRPVVRQSETGAAHASEALNGQGDPLMDIGHFVLAFAPEEALLARPAVERLIAEDLSFSVMPESLGCVYPLLKARGWNEIPVVPTGPLATRKFQLGVKRIIDIVVASLTLVVLLPLMVVVAALIRVGSPGPAIFRQDRVGRHGRVFRIFKFRTMVVGAHADEARLRSECRADARFVKIDCDPRVTRIGRFLRKTSIDELPQLWNVLRGEMSLVGPRPSQPSEVQHYEADQFIRLLAKPGVTGMWQVSGRSDLCFDEAVKLDSFYIKDWNLRLDIRILFRTVGVVLRCRGAC
jgi:exopolysaccharide biosynthesis polyprenyl glycosylphosphotransferase